MPQAQPKTAPRRSASSKRLHPLVRAFLRGLLIVVPVMVTLWLVWTVFVWIDGLFRFERLGLDIPGLGLLIALVLTVGLGLMAKNVLTSYVIEGLDNLFTRTPLVRLVYTSLRDLIDAFVGEKKRFNAPVLVAPFGEDGALVPGFVTRKHLDSFGLKDYVSVYLPQSYNFAGQVLLVPSKCVRAIQGDPTEVMAFIVSAGVSGVGSGTGAEPARAP